MIELTVKPLEPNVRKDLLTIRQRYCDAANQFASAVFVAEPLKGFPINGEMDQALLPLQKLVTGLNKAYVEKARIGAANAVNTLHWRYFGHLIGRLRHVDEKIDPPSHRLYYYVPLNSRTASPRRSSSSSRPSPMPRRPASGTQLPCFARC